MEWKVERESRKDGGRPKDADAGGLARGGFVYDLGELASIDGFEVFVATFELLEGLDGGLGHALVGFGGAADEDEFFAGGDALVAVLVVEADADEAGFAL